jgi:hypothetical protein
MFLLNVYVISVPAVEPLSETVVNDHSEVHQPGGFEAFQYHREVCWTRQ